MRTQWMISVIAAGAAASAFAQGKHHIDVMFDTSDSLGPERAAVESVVQTLASAC